MSTCQRTIVILFQDRFARLVERGVKRQTIRPHRKRPIRVGDRLSLRRWSGKAYRSKQVVLREGVCKEVWPINIFDTAPPTVSHRKKDGYLYSPYQSHILARDDGFDDFHQMVVWFRENYGLPFHGELILWELI